MNDQQNEQLVLISVEDGVGEIVLNRPPVNAFSTDLYGLLIDAVRELESREDVAVILLRSGARIFSAGADLHQLGVDDPKATVRRRQQLRLALEVFADASVPTVVAVHGGVVGIGAMIASGSDIWIAADDSYLLLPEIKVGVVGGYSHFAELLPLGVVKRMVLTGERLYVEEMKNYGLVTEICPREELEPRALVLCREIANFGRDATMAWKSAFRSISKGDANRNLRIEQHFSQELAQLRK